MPAPLFSIKVAAAPNEIIAILRDPPSSQSSTHIEEGTQFSKASSISSSKKTSLSAKLEVKFGCSEDDDEVLATAEVHVRFH